MPPSPIDGDADEATRLTTLAKHAQEQGDYPQALSLYQQALAIREQVLGPHHLEVAASLDNLAQLYQEMKQQKLRELQQSGVPLPEQMFALLQQPVEEDQAIPLYERALAIRERALGPDHPDVATTLDSLGRLHQDLGQALERHGLIILSQEYQKEEYSKALSLYQRALAIRQQALFPNHPNVATSLTNLAKLYEQSDSLGRALQKDALPFYEQALAILEQTQPDHPDTAEVLQNLGYIY